MSINRRHVCVDHKAIITPSSSQSTAATAAAAVAAIQEHRKMPCRNGSPCEEPRLTLFSINNNNIKEKIVPAFRHGMCTPRNWVHLLLKLCSISKTTERFSTFSLNKRMNYEIASRRIGHTIYNCCPGWTKISKNSHGCTKRKQSLFVVFGTKIIRVITRARNRHRPNPSIGFVRVVRVNSVDQTE